MGLFTLLVVIGAVVAMIPAVPVVALLLFVQVVNGVLLPIELVFILLLVNDKTIMGEHTNSRLFNGVAWLGVAVIVLAVGALFATLLGVGG
jgi:Mn2+/Fe2+ NRAMP family transporter